MNKSLVGMWNKSSVQNGENKDKAQEIVQETRIEQTRVKKRSNREEPPATKRKKLTTSVDRSPSNHYDLADLGGVDLIIAELWRSFGRPLLAPSLYTASEITPPRGILLHGPPGCGKTMIANAFAAHLGVSFIPLSAPSIVSGMSGESEKALREYFDEAKRLAPCLIFLDEVDAITPKRENVQREMEKRIVSQLLTCMDDIALEKTGGKPVVVIAATNRPDSLDPALRRGGRFDEEINMPMPTEKGREQILKALTREKKNLSNDIDFKIQAKMTPGFVGADLSNLVSIAGRVAISRFCKTLHPEDMEMEVDDDPNIPRSVEDESTMRKEVVRTSGEPLDDDRSISKELQGVLREIELFKDLAPSERVLITNDDFITAVSLVKPMARREGFEAVPDTTWKDVGALQSVRNELRRKIIQPILHPEKFARIGNMPPAAALLWGPPGCGKTLLAKAVANEANASFISVKGPELLNKFVGESERAVRQIFERARAAVPCLIFFDELDALAPRRESTMSESSSRVVNTLLTELDGLNKRQGVYVLGATNRPDQIDEALLRSGRLENMLFVGLPSEDERVEILRALTRKTDVVFDEAIANVARECPGFSGADLGHLALEAWYTAIDRGGVSPEAADFVQAQRSVKHGRSEKWSRVRGGILPKTGNYTASSAPNA